MLSSTSTVSYVVYKKVGVELYKCTPSFRMFLTRGVDARARCETTAPRASKLAAGTKAEAMLTNATKRARMNFMVLCFVVLIPF